MHYDQNNPLRIIYVGRLVAEKGIDIILSALEILSQDSLLFHSTEWDICGEWEYKFIFEKLSFPNVHIHWYLEKEAIYLLRKKSHVAIVPSRFLETFWLTALESLRENLGVIGFAKWGLVPFIHRDLTLNEENPVHSFIDIIKRILSWSIDLSGTLKEIDISQFSYNSWKDELELLTRDAHKILLVNDYISPVGWAEVYVISLKSELEKLWKKVEIYGYKKSLTPLKRKILFFCSFFAFWRWWSVRKKIQEFQPNLIWCHGTLRYIGFFWMLAISDARARKYLTHHDLGVITPYPSMIFSEEDIPTSLSFWEFISKSRNPLVLVKCFYLKLFWKLLQKFDCMFVPSAFLEKYIARNTLVQKVRVFSHTIFPY